MRRFFAVMVARIESGVAHFPRKTVKLSCSNASHQRHPKDGKEGKI